MLSRLVQLSLRHRGIVIALALGLLVWGGIVASRASLDVFPEFVAPQVTIQTEAPGLSAEQVEVLVTRPVESAVNGASDLASVRSESIQGLSRGHRGFQGEHEHLPRPPGARGKARRRSAGSFPMACTRRRWGRSPPRRWTC